MTKNLTIYTDGGARGNPGPAGIGVVIKDDGGFVIKKLKNYIGEATNNTAEYKALILALEEAGKLEAENLNINMDSELIVRQMQGRYKIKEANLQELAKVAVKLLKNFQSVAFYHVERSLNSEADELVNEAIDEALIKN